MKLEDQTCAREYGEKLAELGVKVESLFGYWHYLQTRIIQSSIVRNDDYHDFKAPAYTATELGEMLPKPYSFGVLDRGIQFNLRVPKEIHQCFADTMVDAMALMLIWLIENGHVKAEELNNG